MADWDSSRTKAKLDFTLQMFVKDEVEKLEKKLEDAKEKALRNMIAVIAVTGMSMTGLVFNLISDHLHLSIAKEKQEVLSGQVRSLEKRLLSLEVSTKVRLDKEKK